MQIRPKSRSAPPVFREQTAIFYLELDGRVALVPERFEHFSRKTSLVSILVTNNIAPLTGEVNISSSSVIKIFMGHLRDVFQRAPHTT